MNNVEIFEIIKAIMIDELEIDGDVISVDMILQDMGIDSIQLMTLIVYIEEKLKIEIDFDESWPIEITSITLEDFIRNISKILQKF
jgi:acyl carrier protein